MFDLKQQLVELNDFMDHEINKNEEKLKNVNDLFENMKKDLEV